MALAILFDSVGFGEWFVLLAVVLIVVGPRRLPSTARKFGQYYSKFRRAADSFKRQLLDMDTEFSRAVDEVNKSVDAAEKEVTSAMDLPEPEADYGVPGEEDYAAMYGRDPDEIAADAAEAAKDPVPAGGETPQTAGVEAPVASPATDASATEAPQSVADVASADAARAGAAVSEGAPGTPVAEA